jgi:hypothetical protein
MNSGVHRRIVAVAGAGRDGNTVDLMSTNAHRKNARHSRDIVAVKTGATRRSARRRRREVVAVGRLVIDLGDGAGSVGAEGVLQCCLGIAVRKETNVDGGLI